MEKLTPLEILNHSSHREWKLPKSSWRFYQEWNRVIFLHWEIDKNNLLDILPKNLEIDLFNGKAWISLVAFTMEKIRPRFLPAFPPVSNFHEVNLRTYVTMDNKPGVYFLNIEAQKRISTYLSKKISGLPYEKSNITHDLIQKKYQANFKSKGFKLDIAYEIGKKKENKTALDAFLTERYCLYLEKNDNLFRYEIHHLPWKINDIKIFKLTTNYYINHINLNRKPNLAHYSTGIQVIAWGKKKLIKR